MRERRCFVQFIHPGGEHRPDDGEFKLWNRDAHRRKFLTSRGHYLERGQPKEGEIVFWGEWEPESRVIARYADRVPDGPYFLYEPFFVEPLQRLELDAERAPAELDRLDVDLVGRATVAPLARSSELDRKGSLNDAGTRKIECLP